MTKWDLKLSNFEISDLTQPSDFLCSISCTAWNNKFEETEIAKNTTNPSFHDIFRIPISDYSKDCIYIKLMKNGEKKEILSEITIPVEQIPPGVGFKRFQLIPSKKTDKGGVLQFDYTGKEDDESASYSSDERDQVTPQPLLKKEESQSSSLDLISSKQKPPPNSSLNADQSNKTNSENPPNSSLNADQSNKTNSENPPNTQQEYSESYYYSDDNDAKKTKPNDNKQEYSEYSYYSSENEQINLAPKSGTDGNATQHQNNTKSLMSTISSIEIDEYDMNSSSTPVNIERQTSETKLQSNENNSIDQPTVIDDHQDNNNQKTDVKNNENTANNIKTSETQTTEKKNNENSETKIKENVKNKNTKPQKKQKKNDSDEEEGGCCSIS